MRKITLLLLAIICTEAFSQKSIIPGMTGAQMRSALNSNFDSVFNIKTVLNPKEFGAVGDGVTNDSAAIVDVLIAAKGREVHFSSGVYVIGGSINVVTDSTVIITGENAVIRASGMAKNDMMIGITGSSGTEILLTANIKVGDYYITVADATPYKKGDVLYIADDHSFGGLYGTGETVMVFGNNGDDSIRLMTPVMFPFLVSENAYLKKRSANPVSISGLKLVGEKTHKLSGIATTNRSNVKIFNNEVSGCLYAGIVIDHGINAYIFNNKCYDFWVGTESIDEYPGGDNYGISIASFRQVEIYENDVYEARHCIETGGYQPCRDINIHNNKIYSTIGNTGIIASISSHLMDAYVTIKDNIIYGDGINAEGQSLNISGNKIYITEGGNLGIKILSERNYSIKDNNIIVRNNEINNLANTAGQYGIYFYPYAEDTVNNLIIEGNISSGMQADFIMSSHDTSTTVIENMVLRDNQFRSKTLPYTDIKDSITVVQKLIIDNNIFYSGIRILGDTTHYARIVNNFFDMNVNSNPITINSVGNLLIDRNNVNVKSQNKYLKISSCKNLTFTNNIVENSTATNPVVIDGLTNLINHSNSIVNCSGAISIANTLNDVSGTNYTY